MLRTVEVSVVDLVPIAPVEHRELHIVTALRTGDDPGLEAVCRLKVH